MTRRGLLQGLLAGGFWTGFRRSLSAARAASKIGVEALQKNWHNLLAEGVKPPSPAEKLTLSKEEWRKRLDANQFYVLREEGTERPGSSHLNNEKRPGVFLCAGCDLALFT